MNDNMSAGQGFAEDDRAALDLLRALDRRRYDFVTVTPETHRRVSVRPEMAKAGDLRGIFGWSLPFDDGLLPAEMMAAMRAAGFVRETAQGLRSRVRVSRVGGMLFFHSAYPTVSDDSVFLGPDTYRFVDYIRAELGHVGPISRIVDIGSGAGVGGIVAGRLVPQARVELVDLNEAALRLARINAAAAGQGADIYRSDGVAGVAPDFDLAIANPPFIIDEGGPAYRAGGDMHGAEVSLNWAVEAAAGLAKGGRVLLYTGSAIVGGRDGLREALADRVSAMGCRLRYRELDPDIFGEELEKPAYADVERIAAIGCAIERIA